MRVLNLIKKYGFSLTFAALLCAALLSSPANAQITLPKTPAATTLTVPTTEFTYLISWRATNYVPASYQGKILAARNSRIEVSFDVLDANGKFVDISGQNVVWYLNNNALQSGLGLKTARFTVAQNQDQLVEMDLPGYKDAKYPGMDKTNVGTLITIPVVAPKIVINAPYPNKSVIVGQNLLEAIPYFFNINSVDQLAMTWTVDGQGTASQGNSSVLNLTTETTGKPVSGANVGVKVVAQNLFDQFEFGQNYIDLDIK